MNKNKNKKQNLRQIWKPNNQNFQKLKIQFLNFKIQLTKLDNWLEKISKLKFEAFIEQCCKTKIHRVGWY